MNRSRSSLIGAGTLLLALAAPVARADFHFMSIVEFFPGSVAAPNAQYVMLQMYSGGQTNLNQHRVTLHDASGQEIDRATFTGPVANGANQARILIATPEANTFFSVTADLTSSFALPLVGGAVCFDFVDCVAWGSFSGAQGLPGGPVGTPYAQASGLQRNEAVRRDLGANATLDFNDDTDDSAADFDPAVPAPRNNAGVAGTIPPSTCGNSVIESLEACDDGNNSDGDACNATCTLDTDPLFDDGFED